jgi:threonine synthase
MDILISSNLERLLFELCGRNAEQLSAFMASLKERGAYQIPPAMIRECAEYFSAYSADEDRTLAAIDTFFDMYGYLVDTHTGVAVAAAFDYIQDEEDETPTIIVSTASPFKFPQDVLLGVTNKEESDPNKALKKLAAFTGEEIPASIAELKNLPLRHTRVVEKNELLDIILREVHG